MKLGTLREGGRDGTLVVVSRDLTHFARVPFIARTMQFALDNWYDLKPELESVYEFLCAGKIKGETFDAKAVHSPLPRAYQWVDGSAYLNHVELVRKARGAEMPPSFLHDPLMYQGGSDSFIAPTDYIEVASESYGIDFESEVAVITDDVSMGIDAANAAGHIKLVMLVNDVSLRNLIPDELAKGFGFFVSKPASAFSPVAVTPDELGDKWQGGKVHLPLYSHLNNELFGKPNAGVDMNFGFNDLVAHAAKTRKLAAGTIVGSGTVSNRDRNTGSSCLAEKRTIEKIDQGEPKTPFMKFGDRIKIEMLDDSGKSIFGAIEQVVREYRE